jgi:NTE family protein
VLTGSLRSAAAQAVRDTELLEIDGARFRELLGSDPEFGVGLATALAHQLQQSGGLDIPEAPPSVFTLAAAGAPFARLSEELRDAFAELGDTISLEAPDDEGPESWGEMLAALERTHVHVLLLAALDGSEWSSFCLRQADRILVVASDPSATRPPAPPDGCDVVFLEVPHPTDVAAWRERGARAHHIVPSEGELPQGARRIARRLAGRSLGLVLSGGGARTCAHIGVLEALEAERIPVDRVGGTSMGAFWGAMVALGWSAERMREVYLEELERRSLFRAPFSDYTVPRRGLIRARRGESMLRRVFGDVALEQLPRPLFAVSADLLSSRMVVHETGPLVEAVGTSMALPGLVPPVAFGGALLVDGGVLNNLPIDVMVASEPGPVLAVDVMRRLERGEEGAPDSAAPTILETLARASVLGSVERARVNRPLARLLITPDVQDLALRDFRHAGRAIEAGRRAAEEALAEGAAAELRQTIAERRGVPVSLSARS